MYADANGASMYLNDVICLLLFLKQLKSLLLHDFLLLLLFFLQARSFLIQFRRIRYLSSSIRRFLFYLQAVYGLGTYLNLLLVVHLHLLVVFLLLLIGDFLVGSLLSLCHVLPLLSRDLANL